MRGRLLSVATAVGLVVASLGGAPSAAEVVPHWTEVYEVPGLIVDVSPTALLYVDAGVLHHVDQDEVDRVVPVTSTQWRWDRQLAAGSVVFGEATGVEDEVLLVQWEPATGQRTELGRVRSASDDVFVGDPPVVVALEGDWIAFVGRPPGGTEPSGVVVRNLVTQAERLIGADAPDAVDVAEDGTVAFVADGALLLDRDGTTTTLVPSAPDTAIRSPRTDGTTTAYARVTGDLVGFGDVQSELRAHRPGSDVLLAGPEACRLVPLASGCTWQDGHPVGGRDHVVDRGVLAWRTADGLRRSVDGGPADVIDSVRQVVLREIGPDGGLLFEHRYGLAGEIVWTQEPHVVHRDGTVVPVHRPDEGENAGWTTTFAGSDIVSFRAGRLIHHHDLPADGSPQVWAHPDDAAAVRGGGLGLMATIAGHPRPDITWQRSTDGVTWAPVDPARYSWASDVSLFASNLAFVVTAADEPYRWYRAVGANEHGTVVTDAAHVSFGFAKVVPGAGSTPESRATAQVPVDLDPPFHAVPVTARWRTVEVPGLADQATPGVDYQPASGTLTIFPGTPGTTIAIPLLGDTAPEADERIIVQVGDPTGAVMGGFWGLGVATVVDDD